jgi:tetrahydromethanopterin S-methyltransferase subunit F
VEVWESSALIGRPAAMTLLMPCGRLAGEAGGFISALVAIPFRV